MELLLRIERHLRAGRIPPTRFGRDAAGDPNFVFDLRDGRDPRQRTIKRINEYLNEAERGRNGGEGASC